LIGAKLSSVFCFCSSPLAVWAVGIATVLVLGHLALAVVG
jgi:hypothetical protein